MRTGLPRPTAGGRGRDNPRRTRTGAAWVGATLFALVLLMLLIFVLENGDSVDVAFFGAHGSIPLGVALLLAAVFGILLIAIPGTGRILQLRRRLRAQETPAAPTARPAQDPGPPDRTTSESGDRPTS
ncbi:MULTISPECIES: lipopolysaccharide assembly protein LapA domain-containing protein [Kitasatospora]|uniref:lipopolysaccharide assembly protein LapA domain-containing protein n=1 Tax=Kitasatospora TaxID=2063 RepID=UPI000C700AAD|nr:lipopolysaccharide assembly protein LapA domain-containing protein [Kitasatospora sp. GP30]MDH6143498.1 putative integral membrane protein [Kitasatospora sp. GP30]